MSISVFNLQRRASAVKIAKDQFFKISFLTAAGSYFLEILKEFDFGRIRIWR